MNKFLSKFAYVAPAIVAIAMIAGMAGINTALADRVSTAAGTVSSVGVSSSGSITVGSSPVTTSGNITADLNLANVNFWIARQNFTTASTSQFTATSSVWVATLGGSFGVGTTSPDDVFDVRGNGSTGVAEIYSAAGTSLFKIQDAGGIGIGSSTPWRTLDVNGTISAKGLTAGNGAGSLCLSSNNEIVYQAAGGCTGAGSVTSVGLSDSNSTLTIGSTPVTTSGTITATLNLGHANSWTALQSFSNASTSLSSHTGASYFGATATTTINGDGLGSIGVGSTSPMYSLTLAAGKSVGALENILTGTSTTYTISAANGAVQLYRTGTAATTFTATGFVPGVKIDFTVCNPGAAAGALTWSGFHTYGTAPTQTTTANQCDKYVVGMTAATSSPNGIMYYAQAGAGLQ